MMQAAPDGDMSIHREPLPIARSRFLYVVQQGTYLRCTGNRLVVTREDEKLLDVPMYKLQGVLVFGKVQVTTHCIAQLMEADIWLSFFSRTGRYRGRVQPPSQRGSMLRRTQYECSLDEDYSTRMARAFVRAKILGQKEIIRAYSKNYAAESFGSGHETITNCLGNVDTANRDSLRGIEGTSTRAYFEIFRRMNRSAFSFERRAKHPAPDPINILLSMGYSMLTRELEGND